MSNEWVIIIIYGESLQRLLVDKTDWYKCVTQIKLELSKFLPVFEVAKWRDLVAIECCNTLDWLFEIIILKSLLILDNSNELGLNPMINLFFWLAYYLFLCLSSSIRLNLWICLIFAALKHYIDRTLNLCSEIAVNFDELIKTDQIISKFRLVNKIVLPVLLRHSEKQFLLICFSIAFYTEILVRTLSCGNVFSLINQSIFILSIKDDLLEL